MKDQLRLRQMDYWIMMARYWMQRGDGFDHLVVDASDRADSISRELEAELERRKLPSKPTPMTREEELKAIDDYFNKPNTELLAHRQDGRPPPLLLSGPGMSSGDLNMFKSIWRLLWK